MKKTLSFVLLLLFMLASGNQCVAQKDLAQPVTLQLDSARMEQFVKAIESQISLHFYYDTAQTDSLFITIHVHDEPVKKVFEAVLEKAGFFVVTDAEQHAFITKGTPLALDIAIPANAQPSLSNNIGTPGGNQKKAAIRAGKYPDNPGK